MIVRLTVDGEARDLDMAMTVREQEECERLTGWTRLEWQRELGRQRAMACAFAWWLACSRAGDGPVPFEEMDFRIGDDFLEVVREERPSAPTGESDAGPTGPGAEATTAGT